MVLGTVESRIAIMWGQLPGFRTSGLCFDVMSGVLNMTVRNIALLVYLVSLTFADLLNTTGLIQQQASPRGTGRG